MSAQKTHVNHAFVARGSNDASDDLIEFVENHDELSMVYQKHSHRKLIVSEGDSEDAS